MPARVPIIFAVLLGTTLLLGVGGRRAVAQSASATIEIVSATYSVPAGTDALLASTYTLRNVGTTPIKSAQVAFYPSASDPIPDAYFFFREWLDGVEQPNPGVTTIFDAGDIGPGASRQIRFQIIVRSSHDFAADAVLLGAPNQTEFARTTIRVAADAPRPAQTASLRIVPNEIGDPGSTAQYRLLVSNNSDDELQGVVVEVAGAKDSALTSIGTPAQFDRVDPDPNAPVSASLRNLGPHEQFETTLTFESRTACAYGYPAVLVRGRLYRGVEPRENVVLPAMPDSAYSLNCADGAGGDLQLPAGGTGPDATGGLIPPTALLLLLSGAGLVALGLRARRGASDMA